MKKAIAGIAVALAAMTAPASADWIHQKSEDPFNGDQHIALGADFSGFTVAFRCTSQQDVTLMLIMPDKPDPVMILGLNTLGPKIAVIVDDQPKVEFEAEADQTPDGDNLRFEAKNESIANVAASVAGASRRVAVAGVINGKAAETHTFDVDGSTRAVSALIKGCNLKPEDDTPEASKSDDKSDGDSLYNDIMKSK
ncbi:hypothetical protein [Hyphomicrobium sp. 802]|uniref:hypothetical protein n=1 Tax=Hyphomicrobium sp. 802 TaxID=1112272 RepID=UPI00045E618A|nr:hypothetical protein [Hyphomicrobium sp. 802]